MLKILNSEKHNPKVKRYMASKGFRDLLLRMGAKENFIKNRFPSKKKKQKEPVEEELLPQESRDTVGVLADGVKTGDQLDRVMGPTSHLQQTDQVLPQDFEPKGLGVEGSFTEPEQIDLWDITEWREILSQLESPTSPSPCPMLVEESDLITRDKRTDDELPFHFGANIPLPDIPLDTIPLGSNQETFVERQE